MPSLHLNAAFAIRRKLLFKGLPHGPADVCLLRFMSCGEKSVQQLRFSSVRTFLLSMQISSHRAYALLLFELFFCLRTFLLSFASSCGLHAYFVLFFCSGFSLSLVLFYRWFSSIVGSLLSLVLFYRWFSSIVGSLLSSVLFYRRFFSIVGSFLYIGSSL
ncbi:hypothetical protein ACVNS2_28225 [Paenibacillus caseinilyticus]|uniref:hypothetical protein n=1 Tax=Paenibacillus mucilaginosus TaxID=61624 RepID=UPI000FFF5148|nr:hypothetical protein [Paenibacillus mucilaginosus]